ncbi:tRNA (guanine-N(7)-)-methyltransferase non-catalytic subunit wuho [Phlebotomus argentipes]|uniref:tRNA (guanine-N(7)-)-methyltransferase non-catalytic subunit wuho n=1 Tax=Phlebotomus argentipes TaxID=94469 RepID=UPI002893483A|nr:tRNA (guanine-N(7)-)-methyltransferase non-catalytic subunit wuho [Phlebotomus argentipes]
MFIFSHSQEQSQLLLASGKCLLSLDTGSDVVSTFNLPERKDPVEADDEDDTKTKPPGEVNRDIQNCAVSGCKSLAVTTNDKFLFLFSISKWFPLEANLVAERKIPRVSSSLRFSRDGSELLVADKSGDCAVYNCKEEDNLAERQLGGHLSIVTDILLTADEKFFVTSDRDEKIRVTRFPESHEIESYCLGHREFVSQIDLLPHDESILVSLSGDSTLRFWNYQKGKQIYQIDIPAAGIRMVSRAEEASSSVFAIYMHETDCLLIVRVSGALELHHEVLKSIPVKDFFVSSLIFTDSQLLCFGVVQKEEYHSKILGFNSTDWNSTDFSRVNETLKDRLGSFRDRNPGQSISGLFKKKYSNIEEYHERKRKRLEGKESNK